LQRGAGDGSRDLPDLARVVLDPAGLGKVLGELAVDPADRLGALVEDDARGACRALVDREDHRRASLPAPRLQAPPLHRRPPPHVHAREVEQLAGSVREAGGRASGGAMLEVEL